MNLEMSSIKRQDMISSRIKNRCIFDFFNIIYGSTNDQAYNENLDKTTFSYDELLGKKFTYYPNNTVYTKTNPSSPLVAMNPFSYSAYAESNWQNGTELTVTAVLRLKEDINYGSLQSGIYYTPELAKQVIEQNIASEIVSYLNSINQTSFNSTNYNGNNLGITYKYSYMYNGTEYKDQVGLVGNTSLVNSMMGAFTGNTNNIYTLTLRELGGINMPSKIEVYPADFANKQNVTNYLDDWNKQKDLVVDGQTVSADSREEILYTDALGLVITMVNGLIDVITYALVAFTALSLLVSTVMIAIITYVSVIERVKEIGVIRSLGGRKKDVSRLFKAETFIIGGCAGLLGIGVTYLLSFAINMIVGSLTGIYSIASLAPITAVIMIAISIVLTSISGLIPAKLASKKDPAVARRSE